MVADYESRPLPPPSSPKSRGNNHIHHTKQLTPGTMGGVFLENSTILQPSVLCVAEIV